MKSICKKDQEGHSINVGESVYKGEIIHHDVAFTEISKVFLSLNENFTPLEDDVWLLTYRKSGRLIFLLQVHMAIVYI